MGNSGKFKQLLKKANKSFIPDAFTTMPIYDFCNEYNLDKDFLQFITANILQITMAYDRKIYMAGGALRRWFQGTKLEDFIQDFDFWFGPDRISKTNSQRIDNVKEIIQYITSIYGLTYHSRNEHYNITYSGDYTFQFMTAEVLHIFNPTDFLKKFDLYHSMFITDGNDIIINNQALKDAKEKSTN